MDDILYINYNIYYNTFVFLIFLCGILPFVPCFLIIIPFLPCFYFLSKCVTGLLLVSVEMSKLYLIPLPKAVDIMSSKCGERVLYVHVFFYNAEHSSFYLKTIKLNKAQKKQIKSNNRNKLTLIQ